MLLTPRQQQNLRGIGIPLWQTRQPSLPQPKVSGPPVTETQQETIPAPVVKTEKTIQQIIQTFTLDNWDQTHQSIELCTNCALAQSCTRKVPGKGNQEADLMIIGEAPGRDEDLQGKPFVGRAGQLLDQMLKAIGLSTESVYISNILKCRPPNNRDPKAEEVSACYPFLQAQIKQIQPKLILSVGRISAQNLLQDHSPVGKLRNQQHVLPGSDIPLIVTYHPAYLLRSPSEKAKVWQDLKAVHKLLKS